MLSAAVVAGSLYVGSPASAERSPEHHTVVAGETLWSIVTDHYPPSEDPRAAVEAIRQANGLRGYSIQPGERLELPSHDT